MLYECFLLIEVYYPQLSLYQCFWLVYTTAAHLNLFMLHEIILTPFLLDLIRQKHLIISNGYPIHFLNFNELVAQ